MLFWRGRKRKDGTRQDPEKVEIFACETPVVYQNTLHILNGFWSMADMFILMWTQASNPDKERRQGKCPLTPEEVGLTLRALGFGSDVHLYVASGEVYGGEATLAPLKSLFPNFHSKETSASKRELAPFSSFSSRMAALDFIVCDESDVFSTNNNGNMAKIIAGRRYVVLSFLKAWSSFFLSFCFMPTVCAEAIPRPY